MKKRKIALLMAICHLFCWNPELSAKTKLAIVIIVDQFAYQFVHKLEKYFTGGLKLLLGKGVVYKNAYQPHGLPATATGFSGFNTGTFAKYHGMVSNFWFDKDGKEIACDDDTPEHAAVFSKEGLYEYGKSAKNMMIDGLSDQAILDSQPHNENHVFALSHKSRSAICLAGKLAKAIWFDTQAGQFTSSKAYFNELPSWLVDFNRQSGLANLTSITWNTVYPATHPAYHLKNARNYTYSKYVQGCIGIEFKIGPDFNQEHIYDLWVKTPIANKVLLDLATTCIKNNIEKTSGTLLVWVGLSPLDLISHKQGPESIETTDLILQLDQQLQVFFAAIEQIVPEEHTVYILSADHGIEPIPELLATQGMAAGRRNSKSFVHDINCALAKTHGVSRAVQSLHTPNIYLNEKVMKNLAGEQKKSVIADIITFVKQQPGIHNAWSYDELARTMSEPYQFEAWYRNQLYPGRSGAIIFQPLPFYQFTSKSYGTTHETPYEYNTHVPLIVYQKGRFTPRVVLDKVWTLQVPNTLAYLLNLPKPSASTVDMLPGLVP